MATQRAPKTDECKAMVSSLIPYRLYKLIKAKADEGEINLSWQLRLIIEDYFARGGGK